MIPLETMSCPIPYSTGQSRFVPFGFSAHNYPTIPSYPVDSIKSPDKKSLECFTVNSIWFCSLNPIHKSPSFIYAFETNLRIVLRQFSKARLTFARFHARDSENWKCFEPRGL